MARIIAEAGVRLRIDGKGLALEIRQVIRMAMREAQATQFDLDSPTRGMADDADRDSRRMRGSFASIVSGLGSIAAGAASAALSGAKLLLIGTAAVGALAGVTQLVLGMGALVGAAAQAAGVVGLLPAAFVAFKASTAAIKLGLQGMSDAMSAVASGDAAAFEEALKNLSPAARDFARAVRDVKPAFDAMRLDVQEALFMDLAEVVRPLADTYLPIVSAGFQGVARQAGMAARETADFMLQGAQVQKVTVFSAQLQMAFGNIAGALRPAVSVLLDLVTTGSTFLPGLTESLNNWITGLSRRVSEAARSGELEAFFQRSIDAMRALGEIASNVFGSIRNIIGAASAEGGGFLQRIQEMTQRFEDFTGSTEGQAAFGGFFESMQRVVDALGPAFLELISVIGTTFLPILADIAQIIGPVLAPMLQAFGRLLEALRPLIQAVADAFATALEGMIPFFDALADAIDGAMPTLGPMLQDIGAAFADLFESMVPLAPLFVQLLEAILPIVPPLIQMAVDLMPRLIEIIEALLPYIEAWAELMVVMIPIISDVAGFLLDVFIPVLEFVMSIFTGMLELITTVVTGIGDVITTVFTGIADFFSNIWTTISDQVSAAWTGISDFFSSGLDGMWQKVKDFGSNIWNSIKTAMSNLVSAIRDGMRNMVDGISNGIRNALNWFRDLPGKILDFFKSAGSWLFNVGKDILQGLWNGLKAMVDRIIGFFRDLVDQAKNIVMDLLGMASPSKVFEYIGEMIGAGMVKGLEGSSSDVAEAAKSMAQAAIDAAAITSPSITLSNPTAADLNAARASGAAPPVIQQTNIMQPGTDVQQFAHAVARRAYGDILSGASTLAVRRNPVQAGVDDQWVSL